MIIVPIGIDCGVADILKKYKIRKFALPFDWVVTYNGIKNIIENDFADFLPRNIVYRENNDIVVLPISWMYVRMMGADGLRASTEVAILSANYISARLKDAYPTLYASGSGRVAHECILDLRGFKDSCGVMAEDVAKRLIDYGFHAPTLSFPVANTLMVEPTESEDLSELDRFIEAMLAIRAEIAAVEAGNMDASDNPLKHAPHTAASVSADTWTHAYSRQLAAYPLPSLRQAKYWAPVGRVDNVYGDRNLFCSCVPLSAYAEQ